MSNTTQPKIIIAIDGHSSTGKSTFAKAIASFLGYIYVDTGAMYRAVTLYALRHQLIDEKGHISVKEVVAQLPAISISFHYNILRQASDTYLNDENVEQEIRGIDVSRYVSRVSAVPEVRTRLVHLQQQMGCEKGVVMDGRDIGTVVFPQAELKIFMTADPHVRADRRYKEMKEKGTPVSFEEILHNVEQRDYEDENRVVAPLRKANDAVLLDNSCMTPVQQMDWFVKQLEARNSSI